MSCYPGDYRRLSERERYPYLQMGQTPRLRKPVGYKREIVSTTQNSFRD